jgi:hypothetical protein
MLTPARISSVSLSTLLVLGPAKILFRDVQVLLYPALHTDGRDDRRLQDLLAKSSLVWTARTLRRNFVSSVGVGTFVVERFANHSRRDLIVAIVLCLGGV